MDSREDVKPAQPVDWTHGAQSQGWSRSQAGQHGGWVTPLDDDVRAQMLAGERQQGRWGSESSDANPAPRAWARPDRDAQPSRDAREEQLRKLDHDYQLWRQDRLHRYSDGPGRRTA